MTVYEISLFLLPDKCIGGLTGTCRILKTFVPSKEKNLYIDPFKKWWTKDWNARKNNTYKLLIEKKQ